MYTISKNTPRSQNTLEDIESHKKNIIEFIIDNLYTHKKVKQEHLSFEILNKMFNDFKYLFTAGYIREFVFIYYRDLSKNKENQKK